MAPYHAKMPKSAILSAQPRSVPNHVLQHSCVWSCQGRASSRQVNPRGAPHMQAPCHPLLALQHISTISAQHRSPGHRRSPKRLRRCYTARPSCTCRSHTCRVLASLTQCGPSQGLASPECNESLQKSTGHLAGAICCVLCCSILGLGHQTSNTCCSLEEPKQPPNMQGFYWKRDSVYWSRVSAHAFSLATMGFQ